MKYLARAIGFFALGATLLTTLVAQPVPMSPPEAATPADEMFGPINSPGDTIDAYLILMERLTGKIILRAQSLPEASIPLILKEKIAKREAIQAIETLLNMNGVALSPLGTHFLKAIPLNLAKSEAPEFIEGSTLDMTPSGRMASKLFELNFLRIGEFMPQIAGLLNPATGSPPIIFEKTNAALVTDSISNLQRIETLVSRLDQPMLTGLQPKFYQVNNVKASDLVNKLKALFTGPLQSQLGTATAYNADDRTNQVILMSDSRQHAFFDDLIAKLDVVSASNNRNEVIPLKHATAKDVASVLSQLVSGQTTAAKAAGQETINRANQAAMPAAPMGPIPMPQISAASLGLSTEASNQFSGTTTILSDERTNAIVVSGTVDDIRLIKELVDKIDILLSQVRIEVVIAEVTLSDNATSGISALGLNVAGDKLISGSLTSAGFVANPVTATFRTATAQVSGAYDLAATIMLSTTPRKTNANILSVPTIITTHNKEGKIFVGEQRPIVSNFLNNGSSGGTTGTGSNLNSGFSSNVTYRDIGIDLKVKPLIGADGSVQLEITQEVNDVLGTVNIGGNDQPRIGKRSTESFVSVKSGEIIVLGGMQRTSKSKNTSRLGPIPILGDLFGSRSREDTRTDLVFFLRPTVLTNTTADNTAAIEQVNKFPGKHRDAVKDALGLQSQAKQ